MKTDEIREKFLKYFSHKNHVIFPSDSLVPKDDPTVLFTSAGMNQFKPYFLGVKKDIKRAASCQKCLRTDDIEKVGKTSYHHTFFEMLGNFSFGDYFKKDAIYWAWEFLTKILEIDEKRLYVSVYIEDKQAYEIWEKIIKINKDKIYKFGEDKNFWPANAIKNGPDGPCGPCSEIFFDLGKNYGCKREDCNPGCDCGRFVEVWNLVFTQYERKGKDNLIPLPAKNIDTGMGLERLASVMQKVNTNFEIDIFKPIVSQIKLVSKIKESKFLPQIYAIADHIRAITFAISDGVFPSNEERGYVIRKLIRKAFWHGYNLGIRKPFLYKLIPVLSKIMIKPYPELNERRENISQIVKAEEEKFNEVLDSGIERLELMIDELKKEGKNVLEGEEAFKLYDTYGFPFELTKEIAAISQIRLDEKGYMEAFEEQRKKSKEKSKISQEIFDSKFELFNNILKTKFVGYDRLNVNSEVIAIFDVNLKKKLNKLTEGEIGFIVVRETPFYAESGGQIGDRGKILSSNLEVDVLDTQEKEDIYLHEIKIKKGEINIGENVELKVDKNLRLSTARNHTATHLLQSALRTILGKHVEQSGSYVSEEKLRFDFTHFKALTADELIKVEKLVNEFIIRDDELKISNMSLKEAKEKGALAFFGEKYKEPVRVIEIGDYSKELCGGTHVRRTGEIGIFRIISSISIASGIRRIEAITGTSAYEKIKREEQIINEIKEILKTDEDSIIKALKSLNDELKNKEILIKKAKIKELKELAQDLLSKVYDLNGIKFIKTVIKEKPDYIRKLIDNIKELTVAPTFIAIGSKKENKINVFIGLTNSLVDKGFDAREFSSKISPIIMGGGGGRKDFVQAGGRAVNNLEKALDKIEEILKEKVKI